MKISGRTQPLAHLPILDCLSLINSLGFDGVEICLENPDLSPASLTTDFAQKVGEYARNLRLDPIAISYHKDYIYDDAYLAETLTAIRLTPVFGSSLFIFAGGPPRDNDDHPWERMLERTRPLLSLAESLNVTLSIEFEPGFIVGSTSHLQRLFADLPSPHLQANLDLGHVFLCDPDPLASIYTLSGKISHGHIENMARGIHAHRLPHDGDMPLASYLSTLSQTGFAGALALDLYNVDYAAVSPAALAYLKSLI